jgi:hypothetical protein
VRLATPDEIQQWDALIAANPDGGEPLQGLAFAEAKAAGGWQPEYLVDGSRLGILLLKRRVPGLGQIDYIPQGPGVTSPDQLKELVGELQKRPATAIKLEPRLKDTPAHRQALKDMGLVSVADMQPNRATVLVDLAPEEADIMAGFKPKTRYNIRLAERRGVTVEPVDLTPDNAAKMYELICETQARAGFFLRPQVYFEAFWQKHAASGTGQLFLASHDGSVLAGIFVIFLGRRALYKDGGSRREKKELQAAYLLQWRAMQWLKERGVAEYDLHGVPPDGAGAHHPLASLVQFKTGFGPISQTVGTWELPGGLRYKIWRSCGERLLLAYYRRYKRELFY